MCQRQISACAAALVLFCCCWSIQPASGTLNTDGQEPWLVVWRKGVDGDALWRTLCPTVSIGEDLKGVNAADNDMFMVSDASRDLQSSGTQQMVLNCSAKFQELFNGFAGHFTLKELDTIKDRYKHSLDYVVSDKSLQVDIPSEVAQEQRGSSWDGPEHQPSAQGPSTAQGAERQMVMDFPANGTAPHRQLLMTLPQQLVGPVAKRRMLPEQDNATWGLDVLDDQGGLDTIYHYTYNGTGVHVYILDTGIRTTHEEFLDPVARRTRAVHGFDAVYKGNSSEDCHGHGSHVAAIVGGNTFGVAKNVTLHAVRVLACDGTAMVSALLKGLEWVAKNHIKPAVVHMSIEGGFSSIINQAVEQLIKVNHVHVVVSSGNSGKDACLASPASSPSAITVAAIDEKLCRWAYANWGACVDVFAPGVAILSAIANKGDDGTAFKTGTSMAAPFVTGVVAAYLETHPGASPEEVQQKLYQRAMRGVVTDDPQGFATMYPSQFPDLNDISSTPNRLLRSNLTDQAMLVPGRLVVTEGASDALQVNVTLSQQPSEPVTVSVTVPGAWDGTPMAVVSPSELLFTHDNWSATQVVALQPRPVCDGDYFVSLSFQGAAADGYPALHTILVNDLRQRSGDTASMARMIAALPFNDTGDSTAFADNYGCQATDGSPDVVYSYTATMDTDVTISTCGSGFDTKLLVSTDLTNPTTYTCNDDDRTCVTNTACSRLDVSFKAGVKYFIVIDGYSGACGDYILSVSCNPACPPLPGADGVVSNVPDRPGRVNGVSPAPGQAESGWSDPASSTRLIQTLLHLSRTPRGSRGANVPAGANVPSTSLPEPSPTPDPPSPSPTPQPAASPAAGRRSQPNSRTPPISSAVRPALDESNPSAASLPAGAGTEPGPQQAVGGPIGVLLGNRAGAAQAPVSNASPANSATAGMIPAQGPLGAIQASSFEHVNTGVQDTAQHTLPGLHGDAAVIELREGELAMEPRPAPNLAPAAEPGEAVGDDLCSGDNSHNHTSKDSTSSPAPRQGGSVLHSDGPEGRRPQQLELVADLGPGPIGLKHAGDEEDAPPAAAKASPSPSEGFQTGLAHGAGGFSAGRGSATRAGPGKQSSRFADLDTLLGTSPGRAAGGVPPPAPTQQEQREDALGGWEAAKANLAALSSESEQLLPVEGRR